MRPLGRLQRQQRVIGRDIGRVDFAPGQAQEQVAELRPGGGKGMRPDGAAALVQLLARTLRPRLFGPEAECA